MTSTVTLHVGDVRDVMAELPDNAFDLLVTSPPFLALRSYLPADHPDKSREIGSEPTPANFIDSLLGLTADWGRLLPEWASICVELGDTMSGSGGAGGDYNADGLREGQPRFRQRNDGGQYGYHGTRGGSKHNHDVRPITGGGGGWPLAKSMCDIPHLYSSSLEYGWNLLNPAAGPSPAGQWRVRNKICWARPNPPVGSLGKRNPHTRTGDHKFRPATSYITVACRGTGRYFDLDAVRTEHREPPRARVGGKAIANPARADDCNGYNGGNPAGAPPLDWHTDQLDGDWLWKLATAPYKGAHYATFPLTLPRRLIQAMCPQRVCVECGWPSERETGDPSYCNDDGTERAGELDAAWRHGRVGLNGDALGKRGHLTRSAPTTGWTDCGHNAWRTGHVLDCFGGSGTTAVAAALEHRDATLIDLDERNIDLVDRRLREHVRILDMQRDGNRITWTVDVVSATELENDAAGQLGLFG